MTDTRSTIQFKADPHELTLLQRAVKSYAGELLNRAMVSRMEGDAEGKARHEMDRDDLLAMMARIDNGVIAAIEQEHAERERVRMQDTV